MLIHTTIAGALQEKDMTTVIIMLLIITIAAAAFLGSELTFTRNALFRSC